MTNRLEILKKQCGRTLTNLGISKVGSKKSEDAVYAFYCGVEARQPDDFPPYIIVCLMAGRYSDLVTFEGS